MDRIKISGLKVYAFHGVHSFEKEKGQEFRINAVLYTDTSAAGHSDDLSDTVSYSDAARLINEVFTSEKYDLIECAAEKCAEAVLLAFPGIKKVDMEVEKPDAPIKMDFDSVSVEISRGWHRVFLGIGSNMGDRSAYIDAAVSALKEDRRIRFEKMSSLIVTKPYGGVEQEDFLNGVIEIETIMSPWELLDLIHRIEKSQGRERKIHWGPRTLDLDILLYDDLIMDTEKLTIPHADMTNREFVLGPLNEIAPYAVHPVRRNRICELYEELKKEER